MPGEFHEDRWQHSLAKHSSDRSLARPPCPQAPQSHPRVAKRSSDRSLARPPCPQAPQSHPRVAKGDFWPVFGTATLPTGTSEASQCGERPADRSKPGNVLMLLPVFGTFTGPQMPQWQHSLAKHYPNDLRPVSFRCTSRSSGSGS